MSYILDALRRADAERERGAVPHLHTQAPPAALPDGDDRRAARSWRWLAAGLALALLAALTWALRAGPQRSGAPGSLEVTAPAPARAAVDAPAAVVPQPVVPDAPALPAPPAAAREPVTASPAPTPSIVPRSLPIAPPPVLARPAPGPAPTPAPPLAASPAPAPGPQPARDATAARREPPAAAGGTAATAAPGIATTAPGRAAVAGDPPALPALTDLPPDVRRELPALVIGGSMYSQNAASRMLIVNGQLLREGDAVSPTVTLEQIRLRSAVLRYKTWRYEIGF